MRGPASSPSRRSLLLFGLAFAAVTIAVFAPFMPHGGLRALWDRTLGYQAGRESPFSLWGQHPGLHAVHVAVEVAAAGLALLVAFVPRGPRTTAQVAALAAAVLIALQLGAVHWFYLYIPWFAPLVLVAVLARPLAHEPAEAREGEPEEAPVVPAPEHPQPVPA